MTADGETHQDGSGFNDLVADTSALYWIDQSPNLVRTIDKDGTSLRTLYFEGTGPYDIPRINIEMMAVDGTHVFEWGDSYNDIFYVGDKVLGNDSGMPPIKLSAAATLSYYPTGIYTDTDPTTTSAATYLVFAQRSSNPGVYRYTVADGGWQTLDTSPTGAGDVSVSTRFGKTLFYGFSTSHEIRSLDMSAAAPVPLSVTTYTAGALTALASDGTYLYILSGGTVAIVDTSGSFHTMAVCPIPCGPNNIATDGVNVYVAGGDLFTVPIVKTGTSACNLTVPHNQLANASCLSTVAVDATSVYTASYYNVYKVHK